MDNHTVARSTKVRGDLLRPGEGRVKGDRPASGHMRESFRATPLVDQRQEIFHLLSDGVEIGHLVIHADEATLSTRAVVTSDVDEERVVHLANVFKRSGQSTDLMVCLLKESGKHLGLASEQTVFVGGQCIPILDIFGFGPQFRVGGNDAHLLLPRYCFVADFVPTCVKPAFVFVRPLPGDVVRRMNRTSRIVHEERFVRRHRLLSLHPANRLIRHVHREMVALFLGRSDSGDTVVDQGEPLICLATNETVEFVKSLACWPPVKGPRYTCFPSRCFMPLAERAGAVSIESEHFGQWCHAVRNLPGVAWKSRRTLHDRARVGGVVIPPAFERHPGRRAKCCGVEIVKTKA